MRYPFEICKNGPACGPFESPDKNIKYIECKKCHMWFQNPLPPKTFEAPEEKGEDGRSAIPDKATLLGSQGLARAWYNNWLRHQFKKPRCLDVGAKYPYFSHVLKTMGCEVMAIDGMDLDTPNQNPIVQRYSKELDVPIMMMDFEQTALDQILARCGFFDAISLIHVFEHMYDPCSALMKIEFMLNQNGIVLLRMPDRDSPYRKFHLQERHYTIHPYYYNIKSFRDILKQSGVQLTIVDEYHMPNSAVFDVILKKGT